MGVHASRTHLSEAVHQGSVGSRQALHVHGTKCLGKLPRDGQAVFQQITQPRGGLKTLADHPPLPIGPTRQIKGSNMQMGSAHRLHTVHGPQVTRVAMHQGGRQQPQRQQLLRAINIGHDTLMQAHTLRHTGLNLLPALRLDDERKQVQRPRSLRAPCVGKNVVAHAVVQNLTLQAGFAPVQVGRAIMLQIREKLAPCARQSCAISYHF